MLCITWDNTHSYENLATEEYFLKNSDRDIFMLWRNDNTIVVGKHQNTMAEINMDYVKEKNIRVVRRLTGGGAVFHDLGNLNFTFIKNDNNPGQADFQKYLKPIIEVLQSMGVNAEFQGRNDITIDGKKFSGNARTVYKNRVQVHGTLLFSSKMEDLANALKTNPMKFKDKSVKSVRARVTNIKEHLPHGMDVLGFRDQIMEKVMAMYPDSVRYELSDKDKQAIQKLTEEKYSDWNWNFGQSPNYNFSRGIRTNGGTLEIYLQVEKGIIQKAEFLGDYFNTKPVAELEAMLSGVRHEEAAIREVLGKVDLDSYLNKFTVDDLAEGMF